MAPGTGSHRGGGGSGSGGSGNGIVGAISENVIAGKVVSEFKSLYALATSLSTWKEIGFVALLLVALASPAAVLALSFLFQPLQRSSDMLSMVKLPTGFKITEYVEGIAGARQMALSPNHILYVGSNDHQVYAVHDANQDGHRHVLVIQENLIEPAAVAWFLNDLYIVTSDNKLIRIPDVDDTILNTEKGRKNELTVDDFNALALKSNFSLPNNEENTLRYAKFYNNQLYVALGAPCNWCDATATDSVPWSSITRFTLNTTHVLSQEIYAKGIRYSTGFTFHPITHDLWFTDTGKRQTDPLTIAMGNYPYDKLNRATNISQSFGFPYCHDGNVTESSTNPDNTVVKCDGSAPSQYVPPILRLGQQTGSSGMVYYQGTQFPTKYRNSFFIAESGTPTSAILLQQGFRISEVTVDPLSGEAIEYRPFATGFLQGSVDWAAPTDVIMDSNGGLLVSDQKGGRIFKITYLPDI